MAYYYQPLDSGINTTNITLPPSTLSGQAQKLVGQYAKFLEAPKRFDQQLAYEDYVAPAREAMRLWEDEFARPEFQYFTLNPFQRQYANQAAVTSMPLQGNAKELYQRRLAEVTQPFETQLEAARQQMEDTQTNLYNQLSSRYFDSK